MNAPIETHGLTKRYRGAIALDHVDLRVPEGSVFALVGPNGAGKTTALQILMNLITPTAGVALVAGRDSRQLRGDDFTRIGYVAENQELPGWMSVDGWLEYLRPFYPAWDGEYAARLVREFHLPGGRKLKQLSRGMQVKAALASSLAYRPPVLVLDEPFTGLDPLVRDELTAGLLDQAGESTILISSHDLAEIESFASHIAYLDGGRLRFSEELSTLSARFREVTVTLDAPLAKPPEWPSGWLRAEAEGVVARFTDPHFDEQATAAEVRRVFGGGVRDSSAQAMPLRSIFVALARSYSPEA